MTRKSSQQSSPTVSPILGVCVVVVYMGRGGIYIRTLFLYGRRKVLLIDNTHWPGRATTHRSPCSGEHQTLGGQRIQMGRLAPVISVNAHFKSAIISFWVFPPHILFSIWRIQQRLSIAKETVTKSLLLLSVTTPLFIFYPPKKKLAEPRTCNKNKVCFSAIDNNEHFPWSLPCNPPPLRDYSLEEKDHFYRIEMFYARNQQVVFVVIFTNNVGKRIHKMCQHLPMIKSTLRACDKAAEAPSWQLSREIIRSNNIQEKYKKRLIPGQ